MKNKYLYLGLVAVVLGVMLVWPLIDPVGLYRVQPSSSEPTKIAQSKHEYDPGTNTLTVSSLHDVVVIGDPGKSFHYVVLWLVEIPKSKSDQKLTKYTFKITRSAKAEHIHGLASVKPQDILDVANSNLWR